jgi:hypothetical protein
VRPEKIPDQPHPEAAMLFGRQMVELSLGCNSQLLPGGATTPEAGTGVCVLPHVYGPFGFSASQTGYDALFVKVNGLVPAPHAEAGVEVGVALGVGVAVGVTVTVGVEVGVAPGAVGVEVGVAVAVGVGVALGVGVDVGVGVAVGVAIIISGLNPPKSSDVHPAIRMDSASGMTTDRSSVGHNKRFDARCGMR